MSSINSSMRPVRPPKVAELVAQAEEFSFNPNIPLKHWIRAAETLYQEANFALSDDDFGRAYLMLYRHSMLVLQYLTQHPEYKTADGKKACRPLAKRMPRVLENLEQLKPEINNVYREWQRMQPLNQPVLVSSAASSTYDKFAARDPSLSGNAKILDASQHQDLAVDLAQRELIRRDFVRRESKQAGLSEEEALRRRRIGRWDSWSSHIPASHESDLQREMEAARRNLESPHARGERDSATSPIISQQYNYPSISRSKPVDYSGIKSQHGPSVNVQQPLRPPKQPLENARKPIDNMSTPKGLAPMIPQKVALLEQQIPVQTPQVQALAPLAPEVPSKLGDVSLSAKKERLTFKPGAYLENGDPIRSVFLPKALRRAFLEIAADNTQRGLEMCGILCGTPINNALFIRCLLIPDQKCTPDTCETENESTMFDYCDSEDLLMLGWIHTHPTQTCFMSSRDLHTHAGYQIMMPESIAIVCAPKFKPSYGIFRLTNPPGLEHILACKHTDTFHAHSVDNLYREAEQPGGHVYETDKLPFHVKDLRTQ